MSQSWCGKFSGTSWDRFGLTSPLSFSCANHFLERDWTFSYLAFWSCFLMSMKVTSLQLKVAKGIVLPMVSVYEPNSISDSCLWISRGVLEGVPSGIQCQWPNTATSGGVWLGRKKTITILFYYGGSSAGSRDKGFWDLGGVELRVFESGQADESGWHNCSRPTRSLQLLRCRNHKRWNWARLLKTQKRYNAECWVITWHYRKKADHQMKSGFLAAS